MGALDCVSNGALKSTDSTEVFTISLTPSGSCFDVPRQDLESQLSKSTTEKRSSLWWTLGTDIPLIILVVLVIVLFELNIIPSIKGGFYCNDPRLSFPFRGESVSSAVLMSTVLLLPLFTIFITEFIFLDSEYVQRARAYQAFRNTMWLYRCYAYGFFFNFTAIELLKGITGSPRPTFFDICEPDTAKTCKGSEFVSTFECTSTKYSSWMQSDSYHSFPSGHASFSVYAGFFVAWYLQRRAFDWRHRTIFLVPFLQMACASMAAYFSMSRIMDNRHHWWDVLTGVAIGIITLFYAVLVLCDNFSASNISNDVTNEKQQSRALLIDQPKHSI